MNEVVFKKTRLPDGSRIEVAREGDVIHIIREDGSRVQLPLDNYLSRLVDMVEKKSDKQMTGLELTRGIVLARWTRFAFWTMVMTLVWIFFLLIYLNGMD